MRRGAFALAVLIIMSCGGSVPAMRMTRFSAMPEHHFSAFDRTVADVATARRVVDAVNALPPALPGRFCPVSFGLRYRLSFNEAARVTLSVVIEGDGCGEVVFTQSDRRATDEAFWDLLANAVGVKTADIYFVKPDEMRR